MIFEILFWHSNLGQISNFDVRNPILTFEFGPIIAFRRLISYFVIWVRPNIEFCHSKSHFDIRTGTEYLILTFLFGRNDAFWHLNFYIHIRIRLQNIAFWHSKSCFDIRTWAIYRIFTFEILLWPSNFRRLISYFVIWIITNIALCRSKSYLTFELGVNISFWHSKSYFLLSNSDRTLRFDILDPIFTFEFRTNIAFWHSNSYFIIQFGPNIAFCHAKCYFDIGTGTEYHILTLEILFCHSNTAKYRILKSYLDIHIRVEYLILTFEIFLFYFRTGADYRIMIFEILFWHSNWDRISRFYARCPNLTFKLGANIAFWQLKSYFVIWIGAEYRILPFEILFRHLNKGRIFLQSGRYRMNSDW